MTWDCKEVADGSLYMDLIRKNEYAMLDTLICKHSSLLAVHWTRGLLWAASHSKRMYSFLEKHSVAPQQSNTTRHADCDYCMITEGWSKMRVGDLEWSNETIKQLLNPEAYGALIEYASRNMFSDVIPYGKAVRMTRLQAYLEVLKLNPNLGDGNADRCQYNASHPVLYRLMDSPCNGGAKAISYLLAHGANPNCGGHRCTCLGLAVAHNKLRLVKMLLDSGADANLPSSTDRLPVMIAVDHKRVKALGMLIEAGAKPPSVKDSYFNGELGVFWLKQNKLIRQFLGIDGGRMVKTDGVDWPLFKRS